MERALFVDAEAVTTVKKKSTCSQSIKDEYIYQIRLELRIKIRIKILVNGSIQISHDGNTIVQCWYQGDKDAEEVRTSDQFMMVKSGAGGDQVRTLLPQIT